MIAWRVAGLALGVGFALAALPGAAQLSSDGSAETTPPGEAAGAATQQRRAGPIAFRSPETGFAALAAAARAQDERALLRILGEGARRLVRSGDGVADRAARDRFAAAYAEKAAIRFPSATVAVLEVGRDGWPLPIPMVRQGNRWHFDSRRGAQELVDRRIGRNELDTIEVLRAIVEAQDEYARTAGRQGGFLAYARRFFSTPGTRDGLYWAPVEGEPDSPLGPLVAAAATGGYGSPPDAADAPRPLHGYFFRILEAQGPAAPGGATEYVVGGRMIGGFGVVAWPARYGVSGIQTFQVSHQGVVYEQDLGPNTARKARAITAFNPEPGWRVVGK